MIFKFIHSVAAGTTILLVLVVCTNVVLRYLFSATQTWMIELEWHLFGLILLLSGAWVFLMDGHVRVDVFYDKLSDRWKTVVDLIGDLVFLLPWCLISAFASWHYFLRSWEFGEGSADPGGLPARYIIKFLILLCFVSLSLAVIYKWYLKWKATDQWK